MKLLRFAGGMLLGALVGGGLMLLFAPRSGAGTRGLTGDWLQAVWSEGQQAAEARRRELEARLAELQRPAR
jgi:gas vesicle protein